MGLTGDQVSNRGKWLALTAALLGWMFDGLEMGLFPLVARPALQDLLGTTNDSIIGPWIAVATASFLVGAATGGVLFGWLGDRIGRVRAMTLSVLTYAVFSGLCGIANSSEQIAALRFLSALGMGGEWSLGVALVMEIWPDQSRGVLAGLIGAAANVGYLAIGVLGLGLGAVRNTLPGWLLSLGISTATVEFLVANQGWRLLMLIGAMPAFLTLFIQLFVPESHRWKKEHGRGTTSHWAARDLIGVGVGCLGAGLIIFLWAPISEVNRLLTTPLGWPLRIVGTAIGLVVATLGYLYPVVRFLQRAGDETVVTAQAWRPTVGRMLLGACLSGVALLGTWASLQWAPTWADQLMHGQVPEARAEARAYAQIWAAAGAILGTYGAAVLGDRISRRIGYCLLCLGSLVSALVFFQLNKEYGTVFLVTLFIAGALTASFYGWLPLYLPELFRTRVRAIGQGFSFNFGRILAAVGALQTGYLTKEVFKEDYASACSLMSLIYLVGLAIIWFAPETRGKPLPE